MNMVFDKQDDFCGVPCEFMQDKINRLQEKCEAYKHYYDECLKDLKKANAENERLKTLNSKLEAEVYRKGLL